MPRRRRGNGEGTISRRKDGRWTARLTVGIDEKGRQKRKQFYGSTRGEVEAKLARARALQLDGGGVLTSRVALSSFLDQWLSEAVRPRTRPSTLDSYERTIRTHVQPHVGRVKLDALKPAMIRRLYSRLEEVGASPRTIQYVHTLLKSAMKTAVEWELISRNPCAAVSRPRVESKEMKFLDEDETKAFLKAAEGDPLEALYVLAITTGMRLGEITGLLWQDVDLKEKRISVCRSLAIINNRPALQETKTASSRRSVELGDRCVTALLQHRARLNVIPHGASPVFSDSLGGLLRPQNLRRRSFYPLLKRAELDRIRFHDLRHTCATLMLQGKTAPKVVSELLGHSSVAFTLDTYAHVIPGMHREAVDELDERLA